MRQRRWSGMDGTRYAVSRCISVVWYEGATGIWDQSGVRVAGVFLESNELHRRQIFTLPSVEIVVNGCYDLFVNHNFLYDACLHIRIYPPTSTELGIGQE